MRMLFFSIITGSEFLPVLLGQLLYPPCLAQTTGQSPMYSFGKQLPGASPHSFSVLPMFLKVPSLPVDFSCADHCPDQGLRVPKAFFIPSAPCLKSCSSQGGVVHLFLSYPLSALTPGQSVACWVCAGDCYAQPLHLQPQECERPSEKCQRQESVWKFLKALTGKVLFSPSRSSNDQNSHHSYAKFQEEEQHMWEHMLKVSWKLQLTEFNHYVPPTQRLQPCHSLQADHSRCGKSSKTKVLPTLCCQNKLGRCRCLTWGY